MKKSTVRILPAIQHHSSGGPWGLATAVTSVVISLNINKPLPVRILLPYFFGALSLFIYADFTMRTENNKANVEDSDGAGGEAVLSHPHLHVGYHVKYLNYC